MSEDDQIALLEDQFIQASGSAFIAARQDVLASGHSVVESDNGAIYEVFPDGHRVLVKQIDPPTFFPTGTVFKLR